MSSDLQTASQIILPSGLSHSMRRSARIAWRAMRSPTKRGRYQAMGYLCGTGAALKRARDHSRRERRARSIKSDVMPNRRESPAILERLLLIEVIRNIHH
jgi:hypothetical protein